MSRHPGPLPLIVIPVAAVLGKEPLPRPLPCTDFSAVPRFRRKATVHPKGLRVGL